MRDPGAGHPACWGGCASRVAVGLPAATERLLPLSPAADRARRFRTPGLPASCPVTGVGSRWRGVRCFWCMGGSQGALGPGTDGCVPLGAAAGWLHGWAGSCISPAPAIRTVRERSTPAAMWSVPFSDELAGRPSTPIWPQPAPRRQPSELAVCGHPRRPGAVSPGGRSAPGRPMPPLPSPLRGRDRRPTTSPGQGPLAQTLWPVAGPQAAGRGRGGRCPPGLRNGIGAGWRVRMRTNGSACCFRGRAAGPTGSWPCF